MDEFESVALLRARAFARAQHYGRPYYGAAEVVIAMFDLQDEGLQEALSSAQEYREELVAKLSPVVASEGDAAELDRMAAQEAQKHRSPELQPIHFLLAVFRQNENVAFALQGKGLTYWFYEQFAKAPAHAG